MYIYLYFYIYIYIHMDVIYVFKIYIRTWRMKLDVRWYSTGQVESFFLEKRP